MASEGWIHLGPGASRTDGFPVILTCTLARFEYTMVVSYRWRCLDAEEYILHEVEAALVAYPLPLWTSLTTGPTYSAALQSAAREVLLHVCTVNLDITGVTPVRYFPVFTTTHPTWVHRMGTLDGPTRTVDDPTLVETAQYLHAQHRLYEVVRGQWLQQSLRAFSAEGQLAELQE